MTRRTSRRISTLEKKDYSETPTNKEADPKDDAENEVAGTAATAAVDGADVAAAAAKDTAPVTLSISEEGSVKITSTKEFANYNVIEDQQSRRSNNASPLLLPPPLNPTTAQASTSSSSSSSPSTAKTASNSSSSSTSSSTASPKLNSVMDKVRIGFALELAMGNWKLFKTAKHVVLDRDSPPPPPTASDQRLQWEAGEKLMNLEAVLGKVEKLFENEIERGDWSVFTTEKHIIMEMRMRKEEEEEERQRKGMEAQMKEDQIESLKDDGRTSKPFTLPTEEKNASKTISATSSTTSAAKSATTTATTTSTSTTTKSIDRSSSSPSPSPPTTNEENKSTPEKTSSKGTKRKRDDAVHNAASNDKMAPNESTSGAKSVMDSGLIDVAVGPKKARSRGNEEEGKEKKRIETRRGDEDEEWTLGGSNSTSTRQPPSQLQRTGSNSSFGTTTAAAAAYTSSASPSSSRPTIAPKAPSVKQICPHCSATFGNAASLARHVQIFHSTPVSCEDCGGVFGSEEELEAHVKESHDVGEDKEEEEEEKGEKGEEGEGKEKDKANAVKEKDNMETNDVSKKSSSASTSAAAATKSDAAEASSNGAAAAPSTEQMEEEDFDEDEMEEFERMLRSGQADGAAAATATADGDEASVIATSEKENEKRATLSSNNTASSSSSSAGVFIKQEIVDNDDVMIENVVREPRRSVTPPIKMEPVSFGAEGGQPSTSFSEIAGVPGASGDFRAMESDPATLHMRRINRPLSKSDVKAYFYPYMPVRVKIRRSTWSVDAWETFFQFRSQKSKERAMRHGHLLHQELPLENLGYDAEGDDADAALEEQIDPKLYFEDPKGKVVELEGVVKHLNNAPAAMANAAASEASSQMLQRKLQQHQLQQLQQAQQPKKVGRPRSNETISMMAAAAEAAAKAQQAAASSTASAAAISSSSPSSSSAGGSSKQNLPKIKLNLQQLQQLLGDKQSGLQKNAQGQLILKMPNKDIGQISEKLKKLSQPQKQQSPVQQHLQQQQQAPQPKTGESLGNVNIIYPTAGGSKSGNVSASPNLSNVIFRGEEKRLIGDLAKASKAGQLQLIQVRKKSGESTSNGSGEAKDAADATVTSPSAK